MRAIVLAAGEGSRLRPLTESKPKVMVEVANRPMLEYVVEALAANDVTEITLVVGFHRERVQSHFEDGHRFDCTIDYAFQESLLGTAHALAQVDFSGEEVLVLGGDNIVDRDLVASLVDHEDGIALVAHASENPSKYGVLTLDGHEVTRIEEKPATYQSEFVNTGVYRFPAGFHQRLVEGVKAGRAGLTHLLQHEIEHGATVHAVRSQDLWVDALYPWDLLEVNARLLARLPDREVAGRVHPTSTVDALVGQEASIGPNAVVQPSTSLGDNVTVGAGSILENCIVYDHAQVGPGCVLRNTIVGEGARLGPRVTALSGPADVKARDGYHAIQDAGAVIGEDARLAGAVTLAPGTMLGARATVDAGVTVRGNVPAGGRVL